jgi:hypothetical protein
MPSKQSKPSMQSHPSYRIDKDTEIDVSDFDQWTPEQFGNFLSKAGLGDYFGVFIKHKISGRLAPLLTDKDLTDMGILIVGDRLRCKAVIQSLNRKVKYDNRTKVWWEDKERLYFSDCEQCFWTCAGFFPDGRLTNIRRAQHFQASSFQCSFLSLFQCRSIHLQID